MSVNDQNEAIQPVNPQPQILQIDQANLQLPSAGVQGQDGDHLVPEHQQKGADGLHLPQLGHPQANPPYFIHGFQGAQLPVGQAQLPVGRPYMALEWTMLF